jgi:predicted kinase
LQSQTNIQIVSIDDIFNAKGFDWNSNVLPGANEWTEIFDESYEKVKKILLSESSVLYDSTNQTLASRNILRDIASSVNADTVAVYVKSSIGTIWERWESNQKDPVRSVVSKDLVQITIDMFEVPTSDESVLIINN